MLCTNTSDVPSLIAYMTANAVAKFNTRSIWDPTSGPPEPRGLWTHGAYTEDNFASWAGYGVSPWFTAGFPSSFTATSGWGEQWNNAYDNTNPNVSLAIVWMMQIWNNTASPVSNQLDSYNCRNEFLNSQFVPGVLNLLGNISTTGIPSGIKVIVPIPAYDATIAAPSTITSLDGLATASTVT